MPRARCVLADRRDVLRRHDAARPAVDVEREVFGREPAHGPAVIADDADVDRHEIDGQPDRGRRLLRRVLRQADGEAPIASVAVSPTMPVTAFMRTSARPVVRRGVQPPSSQFLNSR